MAVIGVIAQGMMGAGVGRRLSESGATVRTLLTGRSRASAERAKAAGMTAAANEHELLAGADFFLSILPPGESEALARQLAPALKAALASRAICSGVTGTLCCFGSVRTPFSAQVMTALSLMACLQ